MSFTIETPLGTKITCQGIDAADIISESGGPGTQVYFNGPTGPWPLWKEGEDYPDAKDAYYHLFLIEFKRTRECRKAPFILVDIRDGTPHDSHYNLCSALRSAQEKWEGIPIIERASVNPFRIWDRFRNVGISAELLP